MAIERHRISSFHFRDDLNAASCERLAEQHVFFSYTRPGKLTVCYGKSAFSMGKFTLLLVKRLPSGKLRVCYGIDGPFSSLIYLSKIG